MAPKRLAAEVARVTGADVKNPQRYRGRAAHDLPELGPPPDHLTEAERKAWQTFAEEMPWLRRSDRAITTLAATVRAKLQTDPAPPLRFFAEMRLLVACMGGTPADRTKVTWRADDDGADDPAREFLC